MATQAKKDSKHAQKSPHNKKKDCPMLAGSPLSAKETHQNTSPSTTNRTLEKPISQAYKGLDTDLARDNLEGDTPAADLQDL